MQKTKTPYNKVDLFNQRTQSDAEEDEAIIAKRNLVMKRVREYGPTLGQSTNGEGELSLPSVIARHISTTTQQ